MVASPKPGTSQDAPYRRRARLLEEGLRPVTVWVPDIGAPDFKAEAHRQSLAVAASAAAAEDQTFIDFLGLAAADEAG